MNSTRFSLSLLLPLASLSLTAGGFAESQQQPIEFAKLTTLNGKAYEKVLVVNIDPDGIRLKHQDGAAKIPFNQLSVELQKRFGYDPEKALTYSAETAEKFASAREKEAADREKALATRKETEFRTLRKSFLEQILRGTDLPNLRDQMESKKRDYEASGNKDWANLLEEDLQILRKRLTDTPSPEMTERSKYLERQVASLREELRSAATRSTRSYSAYPQPYVVQQPVYVPYPTYYRNYAPYCPPTSYNYSYRTTQQQQTSRQLLPSGPLLNVYPMGR